MNRSRLVPLGLAVAGLLVVAAVAASGGPLGGGGRGSGPTAGFFDYVFTTIVIVGAAVALAALWGLVSDRTPRPQRRSSGSRFLASMLAVLAMAAIAWALVHSGLEKRLRQADQQAHGRQQPTLTAARPKAPAGETRGAHIRWEEVAVALGLLVVAGAVVLAARSRKRLPALAARFASQAAVSAALDESLDDLRSDPDLRRAIVAAYARMERALAAAGLPRRPAEAPLEYLERALLELETSAGAVSRLTHLFEWAKFSQHEPEPSMRDEAIDALVAVRNELRAPRAEAVA